MPVLFFATPQRNVAPARLGRRVLVAFCACALALYGATACDGAERPSARATVANAAADDAASALRDDFGQPIDLARTPTRVISLNPTTTEIIYALGAQSRLIGRSHWDKWPAAAISKPDVGDGIRPNVEQLIAAHPDLVILYATDSNRDAAARLAHADISTLSLRINSVHDFDRATRMLGRVLGDSAAGAIVADSVNRSLARVRAATQPLPHPTTVWRLADRPPMVVGGGSFMSELLEDAGARNLYAQLSQPSPVVAIEDVVIRNPDVVIIGGDMGASSTSLGTWNSVPAVTKGRVVSVSSDLVARPSVQMGAAAAALARALHPGLVLR
ncbi:MAG: ABC transporter substrate-binding protein [Gemmatimonadaceae bacterium]